MYLRLEKSASSKETKSGQGLFQKMVRYWPSFAAFFHSSGTVIRIYWALPNNSCCSLPHSFPSATVTPAVPSFKSIFF
jgi:hypothetical protein